MEKGSTLVSMLRRTPLVLLVLFATVSGCSTPTHSSRTDETATLPAGAGPATTAIIGVDVVPMNQRGILRDQTVLVQGDRIVEVGPAAETPIPAGATRMDGTGRYLVPGLAEMHGHIPPPGAGEQVIRDVLFLYLSNGITTVRGMLGAPGQLELRTRAAEGEIDSPTLYLAGPSFNGQSIGSPSEARQRVRDQKREGWDLLKIHPGLTREEYDAMAETARAEGIRFGGHVAQDVGLLHALESGQETLDHMDGYVEYLQAWDRPVTDEEIEPLVEATREAGAWIVPTSALWKTLFCVTDLATLRSYPELRYVSSEAVENWSNAYRERSGSPQCSPSVRQNIGDNRTRILGALYEAGVPILMGTDAPQQFSVPGFSLHRELDEMQSAGMTAWSIIESGTASVGRYFSSSDNFGTIRAGQRADLVLLRSNPLDDIGALQEIDGVMVRGTWFSRDVLDARLAEIDARNE